MYKLPEVSNDKLGNPHTKGHTANATVECIYTMVVSRKIGWFNMANETM